MNEYIDRIVVGGVEYPVKDANSYIKPVTGIPATDLAEAVQTSLGKADTALQSEDLAPIEEVIPDAASSENQLADKGFVNSSIATATATFRGTYNLVSDLSLTVAATQSQIATALATAVSTADNNDYVFVQIPTADATPSEIARIDRYKYNGTAWAYEFSLNNSSFTAAQWAAINSGITAALVTKLGALPSNTDLQTALSAKYEKPSSGIPSTDLASGVIPDVSAFITKTVDDLTNYYLKSETYTKAEVQALIATIQGLEFVPVASLPTASADTLGKIYIVPAANPQTQNQVDEYYTKDNGTEAQTRYTWELFGSASIDLSGYVTTTMLNTALADYTTTANLTTLLNGKQDTLTFDNTPTKNSNNPVKSGGVYDEVHPAVVNHGTSDTTFALTPNVLHIWGEVASLTLTLATPTDNTVENEYRFRFVSGSTATTLTLPNTVVYDESKGDLIPEADKIYEVSIEDNIAVWLSIDNS